MPAKRLTIHKVNQFATTFFMVDVKKSRVIKEVFLEAGVTWQ